MSNQPVFPKSFRRSATIIVLSLIAIILFGLSSVIYATGITVDSMADNATAGDGACTLREAILNANFDNDSTGGDCAPGSGCRYHHHPDRHVDHCRRYAPHHRQRHHSRAGTRRDHH